MNQYENAPADVESAEGAKEKAGKPDSHSTLCRHGFTLEELAALQRFCLRYRDLVRSGRTPTPEQDARFVRYSAVCYMTGAAYVGY
jgi:hypothetical protein